MFDARINSLIFKVNIFIAPNNIYNFIGRDSSIFQYINEKNTHHNFVIKQPIQEKECDAK